MKHVAHSAKTPRAPRLVVTEARSIAVLADKGSLAVRLHQSAHPIISTLLLPVISYDEPSPELTGDCPEAAQRPTGEL